jgi:hypothetical protein
MTKEEFAALLDGRKYREEITVEEAALAKQSKLVVVFGYSDDATEFRGAILDEIYTGIAYLDENGLFTNECEDKGCPYAARKREKCKTIRSVWSDDPPHWTYETEIPHAEFDILEYGEVFCVGIIFDYDSLKSSEAKP